MKKNSAIFLDRDGVLIEDVNCVSSIDQVHIFPNVSLALNILNNAGYQLIVVSNQAVVARGLMSESDVKQLNSEIVDLLAKEGAPILDGFFFCPHHPQATDPNYRVSCECRKPRPGLLLRAAEEMSINLHKSFMIGDRITDILAGINAGCRTILVETGAHLLHPIITSDILDFDITPDFRCSNLYEAAICILETS